MNLPASVARALLVLVLAGCGGGKDGRVAVDSTPAPPPPPPPDSLALTAPGGIEVWFTSSRSARDSGGQPCLERVMEIRREGRRIPIPLLYTGSAPRLVNDSTLEAPIWLNCRPGNVYQVNLATGQPVRVK